MATSDARAAAPRVVPWRARVVRAARILLLAAGMAICCFLNLNHAGAAAYSILRAAVTFVVRHYMFFAANSIVCVLFVLTRRDDEAFSFSAAAFFARWWPSDADALDWCLPLPPGSPLMLMLPPPPAATEAAEEVKEEEEEVVFEDKIAVHVTTVRAKPPRRSRSEKARRRRAAAKELWRAESENGRQQAEPEVSPVDLGMDGDEEAFQRFIDAYILKQQTQFQYEESAAAAKAIAAAAAAAAVGNGGLVAAAGAAVAVKRSVTDQVTPQGKGNTKGCRLPLQ
ncbi:unnamed protein product [Urochloa humidicola]